MLLLLVNQAATQPTLSQQLQSQQPPQQQQQMQGQNQANLFEQLAQAASSGAALQKVCFGSHCLQLFVSVLTPDH